ncbi:MAG: hypothetical protein R6V72_08080 [Cyclobacterium sp.]|uniref:hypothetical protein n=1 Tax=Cyclobacterium sp. TaxID=1966343 RepID=UPI0039710924
MQAVFSLLEIISSFIGFDLFFSDGNPLPMATNQYYHYEAITGGPDFRRALLQLYQQY